MKICATPMKIASRTRLRPASQNLTSRMKPPSRIEPRGGWTTFAVRFLTLLFEHPAILAAIKYIEHQTEIGETVLVFG